MLKKVCAALLCLLAQGISLAQVTENKTAELPSAAIAATVYVTTTGNDSNSCLSWQTACATIQSALAKLPTNGGLVEVGYGTFSCFTVDNSSSGYNIGLHVRGRGIGSWWNPSTLSSANATYQANQHATIISNTSASTDCITLKGNTTNYSFPDSFVLEDLAVQGVTGGSATRDGIVINYVPHLTMRRVVSQSNGRYGINIQNSYWLLLDTVRGEFNTSDGLNTSNTVNLIELSNDVFDDNGGNGATLGPGQAVYAHNSDFSRNTSHGVQMSNGGPFTLVNNFIEANLSSGITNSACGGNYNIFYNEFSGNNAQTYGVSALCSAANGDVWNIVGNSFNSGDKFCSIEFQNSDPNGYVAANQAQGEGVAGGGSWINCFIVDDPAGTTKIVYSGSAQQQARTFLLNQRNLITLAAAGNITLDRNLGQYQVVTVNASQGANTTTITNGHKGDLLTIEWLQGGVGSFTYVWPANVKFAAGTAPTASTAAGSRDIVTFEYDVTAGNWYEIARSIGVH